MKPKKILLNLSTPEFVIKDTDSDYELIMDFTTRTTLESFKDWMKAEGYDSFVDYCERKPWG